MLLLNSKEDLEHGVHSFYLGNHRGNYQDVRHVQKKRKEKNQASTNNECLCQSQQMVEMGHSPDCRSAFHLER